MIDFDHALLVANVGLVVNAACAWILMSTPHEHGYGTPTKPGAIMNMSMSMKANTKHITTTTCGCLPAC